MTDREILEMAARAAGLVYNGCTSTKTKLILWGGNEWNPLGDDGDAFRLAAKLRLLVECGYLTVNVRYNYDEVEQWSLDDSGVTESVHGDVCKAARRAVVRAAAEIGSSMKGQK